MHQFAKRKTYPNIKFPAPKMIQPKPDINVDTAYAEFKKYAEMLRELKGETVNSPPFGVLSVSDYVKIQLLHGAHHLSYLRPT